MGSRSTRNWRQSTGGTPCWSELPQSLTQTTSGWRYHLKLCPDVCINGCGTYCEQVCMPADPLRRLVTAVWRVVWQWHQWPSPFWLVSTHRTSSGTPPRSDRQCKGYWDRQEPKLRQIGWNDSDGLSRHYRSISSVQNVSQVGTNTMLVTLCWHRFLPYVLPFSGCLSHPWLQRSRPY